MISWVADHRKHHAFSDREGDPHSPHVDHGVGWRGALRGLAHAHPINSLCHFFGVRDYATEDHSRNLLWLALPTFGEAWHNNHPAFPTSASHGLSWRQPDPSALVIRLLASVGLVWDVVVVDDERRGRKRYAAA